jgi:hypothetical protein
MTRFEPRGWRRKQQAEKKSEDFIFLLLEYLSTPHSCI